MEAGNKMRSLKYQIIRFHSIGFCIVFLISIMYIIMNLYTVEQYRSAFYQYRYISEFYDALNEANEQFKEYLYSDDEDAYRKYNIKVTYAQQQLDKLNYSEYDDTWRIRLLQNMLDSYSEQVAATKQAFRKTGDSYEQN